MMKFKYIGIGIAIGLILSLHILSENKVFNFFGREFICEERDDGIFRGAAARVQKRG